MASGGGDCNDTNPLQSSQIAEIWYDGLDGNCDGKDDFDRDGDHQKAKDYSGTDCNDNNPAIYLGAFETWYNGIDENCDGKSDYDQDGDSYDKQGTTAGSQDCNDLAATVSPAAAEAWYDGIDQNCDGKSDYDQDGDFHDKIGFGTGDDCDDVAPLIYPTATELADAFDNDCDGYCDENSIAVGSLLITEIMPNPEWYQKTTNPNLEYDEWLEAYNPGISDIAICKGWVVGDPTGDVTLEANIVIPSKSYVVFGYSTDPTRNNGVDVEQAWGGAITLSNQSTGDTPALKYTPPSAAQIVVDSVPYTSSFPWAAGVSMQLKFKTPGVYYDATENNSAVNWCAGTSDFGGIYSSNKHDKGTPGFANNCP